MKPRNGRAKIVYVFPHPPTTDFRKKFFSTQLQEEFETEYWDVGPLLGYNMKFIFDLNEDGLKYIKITGLRQLNSRLKNENRLNTVYVLQITRALDSFPLYFLLSCYKLKTTTLARGYLPSLSRSERTYRHYLHGLANLEQIKRWASHAMYILVNKFLPIRKYEVAFVAGRVAEQINLPNAIKMVRIHHADVDTAIHDKPCTIELPDRYCVFVDDYLPYHPDFGIGGSKTVNAAMYYSGLNEFFDKVESKFGTTVIIAAHPKAVYDPSPFEGRKVLMNETNALVKDALVVFAHASTAVSFAVFHKKPLCLIFNDEIKLKHPALYASMLSSTKTLGCPMINFEKDNIPEFSSFEIDSGKYDGYYTDFLSNDISTLTSFSILEDELRRLACAGQ